MPRIDDRKGIELGGGFNNSNVEKLGVTVDLRLDQGRHLLRRLIAESDAVTENFSAGVMARLGFSYDELKSIRSDIIYVSNSGFGHTGPYSRYKTFGPIVQALCGLTFGVGTADGEPCGWGYSYMDHMGANMMVLALLAAVLHRNRNGEGQWVDISCTEAGLGLTGPDLLDYTVNGRRLRRPGMPDSNHSDQPLMVPHGIFPSDQPDRWVAIACRDDRDWAAFAALCGGWASDAKFATVSGRLAMESQLDGLISEWTSSRDRDATASELMAVGVPAATVALPVDRIDLDVDTGAWRLFPTVKHPEMGQVRVDGIPAHLSETDWEISRAAPLLGEHNRLVFCDRLGLTDSEFLEYEEAGVFGVPSR